ncbi:Hint domain-containing protein [uncultured Roseovarius sp.]|uniref:Hint domain-containing protein n=1 Tax=uncultured Roseovarius sp. TaxID=293344 RepID=UPI00261E738B|nr:Hint domain-containing protein [uncultured Roseovarius sp.]
MGFAAALPTAMKTDRRYLTGLCGGANVRTPLGARHVEILHPGDMVVTRDNGLQPVRMIWSRTVTAAEMHDRPELAPIRLKPRAVGPMMPARDLRIACGHRALIPGYRISGVADEQPCLMRVGALADASDEAFADMSAESVTFYNLVFDNHEVFCAEGLPVESFRPSPKAIAEMDVAAREELFDIFPQISPKRCAYPGLTHPTAQARAYRPDCA